MRRLALSLLLCAVVFGAQLIPGGVVHAQTTSLYATPAPASCQNDAAVTLGVQFRSSQAGSITHIRFYRFSTVTGSQTVGLYTTTGTLLASATYSGGGSGWVQQAITPVAIAANTDYVAAYIVAGAWCLRSSNGFPVSNSPLSASTGRFVYGGALAYPSNLSAADYMVDVIFALPTPTPTNTPVPPTATNTPTNTPVPPTATNTPTNTPIPPTATNTPIPPTSTNTPTNTPIPPTATNTPTNTPVPPTATATPTNTAVPPTATATATNSPTPIPPTDTPTNTVIPPTDTPTSTPAPPTATSTNTPTGPTDTPTLTPTPGGPTPTPTATNTPEPYVYATVPGVSGTPQLTRFDYVVNAGDVHISNLLALLLFSLWAFFLFLVFGFASMRSRGSVRK